MRPVTVKDGVNRRNSHEIRIQSLKGRTSLRRGDGPRYNSRHNALQEHGSLEVNPACMTKMRHYFGPISLLESEVPTFSEPLGVLVFAGGGVTSRLGADHQDVAMIRRVFEKGPFRDYWRPVSSMNRRRQIFRRIA